MTPETVRVKMLIDLTRAMWGSTYQPYDTERQVSIADMGYRDYLIGLYITLKYGYEEWGKWWRYQQTQQDEDVF